MTGTNASGCGAESVGRARRPSRSCPIGWRRSAHYSCVADSRLGSASPPVTPWSKPRRTARIRRACPIHRPCADGHNGDCSACAAGRGPELPAQHFLRAPTILAWDLGALCRILPIGGKQSVNRQALDDLKQQIPCWTICKLTIGSRSGRSAAVDGWGCARCMTITNQASWWIPARTCSTATAVAAAAM